MKNIFLVALFIFPLICMATPPVLPHSHIQKETVVNNGVPVRLGGVYPADTCASKYGCLKVNLFFDEEFSKVNLYWFRYLSGELLVPYTGKETYVRGQKLAPLGIPLTYEGNQVFYTKIWFTRGTMKQGVDCMLGEADMVRTHGQNPIREVNLYAYEEDENDEDDEYENEIGLHCKLMIPPPPEEESEADRD